VSVVPSAEEVCATFGLGVARGPMTLAARGEQGVVWRLDTERDAYAVKQLLVPQHERELSAQLELEAAAAKRGTSFTLPRTVRTRAGNVLAELADWQVRVQTWVDIAEPDIFIDPWQVGLMLAELHAAGSRTAAVVDPWYTAPVGVERWEHYLSGLEEVSAPITPVVAEELASLIALEAMLTEPTDMRMCHRDLWADNVRASGGGRLCVIDWDNAGSAGPSHELGMVLWEFSADDPARARALYDSYLAANGPGRVEGVEDFTMAIAQFGHFWEAAIMAWLDPESTQDDLIWGQARIDELTMRRLTPGSMTSLLDAVSAA
jgi:Ser/Thr protein kinase RdoA (MazF antagonist)